MYSTESLKFFRGIKKNPNKIWYEKHKESYKSHYVAESAELIQRLTETDEFRVLGLHGSVKKGLFRLHRDVRFSHNKIPYKHWNGFVMSRSGNKINEQGFFYLHTEPGKCFMAMGFWHPDPKLLASMRNWIVEHPQIYLDLEKKLKSRKLLIDNDDSLKRLPQGFQAVDNQQLHVALKRRHFIVKEDLTDAELCSSALIRKIKSFAKRSAPLVLWGWSIEQGL